MKKHIKQIKNKKKTQKKILKKTKANKTVFLHLYYQSTSIVLDKLAYSEKRNSTVIKNDIRFGYSTELACYDALLSNVARKIKGGLGVRAYAV